MKVRVWETSAGSYENAVAQGKLYGEFATGQPGKNLFLPLLGGDPRGDFFPALLNGLQPLTLVPEPGKWALLMLGGVICFAITRHSRK